MAEAGGALLGTFGSGGTHDDFEDDWLGVPMFFSGFDATTNERLVEAAGLRLLESRVEERREPEGDVRFHWVLAKETGAERDADVG